MYSVDNKKKIIKKKGGDSPESISIVTERVIPLSAEIADGKLKERENAIALGLHQLAVLILFIVCPFICLKSHLCIFIFFTIKKLQHIRMPKRFQSLKKNNNNIFNDNEFKTV